MDQAPFQSYLTPQAAPAPWANANTYAPWQTPNGATGSNPSFSGYGGYGTIGQNSMGLGNDFNSWLGTGSFFGLGKKNKSFDFSAPAYQGTLFTPTDGSAGGYALSPEAMQQQQTQSQGGLSQASTMLPPSSSTAQGNTNMSNNITGPAFLGASGLASSQSYVGQQPYGSPGQTYMPSQGLGGASYGGYSSYGGYGASGNTYQPGY